ncbi:MAG TPA: nucleotidyltransferase domain-containing protein [Trichocoleus sp.]
MKSPLSQVDLSQSLPQVRLLVLFGSRAKGTATEGSDWDLGVSLRDPAWVPRVFWR